MDLCDCDNCFTITSWYSYPNHIIEETKYCTCDECFEDEIINCIHNGKLNDIYELDKRGILDRLLDTNKRLVDTLETLIDEAISFEEFRLDVIDLDGHDKNIEIVDFIDLIAYLFYETDLYDIEVDYVSYALNYIHEKIYLGEHLREAVDKIHEYFVGDLIKHKILDVKWDDYYMSEEAYDETIVKCLLVAMEDGGKGTVELILKNMGTQIMNRIRKKELLEELDQVFWQPGGIRYFEFEEDFNQLKQLTV